MTAKIIPFPPTRVRRMVEPTYVHGGAGHNTGLAWFLQTYMDVPTVQNGYDLATQYAPLYEHYSAKFKKRGPRKPRKPKG